jgi:hypothetical protein
MLGSVLDWSGVEYSSRLDRALAFASVRNPDRIERNRLA